MNFVFGVLSAVLLAVMRVLVLLVSLAFLFSGMLSISHVARAECSPATDALHPDQTCIIMACDLSFIFPGWSQSENVFDVFGGPNTGNLVGRIWVELGYTGTENPPPLTATSDQLRRECRLLSRDTSISFEDDLRRHGVISAVVSSVSVMSGVTTVTAYFSTTEQQHFVDAFAHSIRWFAPVVIAVIAITALLGVFRR